MHPTPLFDTLARLPHFAENPPATAQSFTQDYRLAQQFLFSYRGSEATFNAYRRDIERLLHWSWHIKKSSILALRREDIEQFIEFCQKPPADWIGDKNVARFVLQQGQRVANPHWRPFVRSKSEQAQQYTLTQSAMQSIFAVLSTFYNFLLQEDCIAHNPIAQMRQKSKFIRKQQTQPVIRRLSELQWSYVIETAEQLAAANSHHERTLFIMNALYSLYLRISELCASARWWPMMQHFYQDYEGNWWFKTVGKGNKERIIAVSDAMLQALKRYRCSLGLSALPALGENHPLLPKQHGAGPITSTRQIRSIVQTCFDHAIARMQDDGFAEEAMQLQAATVHWLRHTGISEDVKHRPREHVRDDAGHASGATTDRYIDVALQARHASSKNKKIKQ